MRGIFVDVLFRTKTFRPVGCISTLPNYGILYRGVFNMGTTLFIYLFSMVIIRVLV